MLTKQQLNKKYFNFTFYKRRIALLVDKIIVSRIDRNYKFGNRVKICWNELR
jgi:hypothetical protein